MPPVKLDPLAKASCEGFGKAVNEWLRNVEVPQSPIDGTSARIMPGTLHAPKTIEATIFQGLLRLQPQGGIAQGIAKELADAWEAWAEGFTITLDNAFPTFLAMSVPVVPPTPAVGVFPVKNGTSTNEFRLRASELGRRLGSKIKSPPGQPGDAMKAVADQIASWVDESFSSWAQSAQFSGAALRGEGTVPTFNPPAVMVGPVLGGHFRGRAPFVGPSFGAVLL